MGLYKRWLIDESNVGKTFGNWTQLGASFASRIGSAKRKKRCAVFQCACGLVEVKDAFSVTEGKSKKCKPCQIKEVQRSLIRHGKSKTRVHNIWWGMITRCENPNVGCWELYGGRGISVCDRWRNSFEAFYEDMGDPPPKYQIDRIDCNGNYEPGNCRWVTALVNARNKRRRAKK